MPPGFRGGAGYVREDGGYTVLDLTAQGGDSYAGYLAFEIAALLDQYGHGWTRAKSPGNRGHVILPIRVYSTEDGWCVEETDRRIFTSQISEKDLPYPGEGYPAKTLTAEGKSGTVTISYRSHYTVGGEESWGWTWDWEEEETTARDPDPHKALPEVTTLYDLSYTPSGTPTVSYTVEVIPLAEGEEPAFLTEPFTNALGYDGDGSVTVKKTLGPQYGPLNSLPHVADFQRRGEEALLPTVFHVRVQWDDEVMETYALKEEPA